MMMAHCLIKTPMANVQRLIICWSPMGKESRQRIHRMNFWLVMHHLSNSIHLSEGLDTSLAPNGHSWPIISMIQKMDGHCCRLKKQVWLPVMMTLTEWSKDIWYLHMHTTACSPTQLKLNTKYADLVGGNYSRKKRHHYLRRSGWSMLWKKLQVGSGILSDADQGICHQAAHTGGGDEDSTLWNNEMVFQHPPQMWSRRRKRHM